MSYINDEAKGASKANNLTISELKYYLEDLYPCEEEGDSKQRKKIRRLTEEIKEHDYRRGILEGIVRTVALYKQKKLLK